MRHFEKTHDAFFVAVYNESGAPNGPVPQNICSTGKFLLAGRFGKNDRRLDSKTSTTKSTRFSQ